MKKNKIICTIGPASNNKKKILEMVEARLACLTSKYRPTTPIFTFTQSSNVKNMLSLYRGVYTYPIKLARRSHINTMNVMGKLRKDGFVGKDSQMIWVKKVQ